MRANYVFPCPFLSLRHREEYFEGKYKGESRGEKIKDIIMRIVIVIVIVVVLVMIRIYEKRRSERIIGIIRRYDRRKTILEIGSGSGCNARRMEEMGYKVTAIDIEDKSRCKRPRIFDGERIPYGDKTYDIVICTYVLHHTNKQEELLKEMRRVGKEVIIIENTAENKMEEYLTRIHARSEWGKCEECFRKDEEWEEKFRRIGYEIKYKERISPWYYPFADKPYIYPVTSTAYILK